ncbi:MAG: hypothetical protein ACP5GX_07000 [Anaerolineae bacterium]
MASLLYKLLKNRGIFFYLLFIGYLVVIHPGFINRLSETSLSNPDPLLGWVLLLLPFLELVGFWLKYPYLARHVRNYPQKRSNWTIMVMVLLPVFHLGMSAFLFIVGTQIAGLQPRGDAAWYWQLLYVVGFFLVIIKELVFLLMFFLVGGMEWTRDQPYPPDVLLLKRLRKKVQEIRLNHLIEDTVGDVLLLIFSSLGYTALWEYIGMSSPIYMRGGFWDFFFQLLGLLIYFMMIIPPLQAVYLLQDTIVRTTRVQKLWSAFQFAMTLVAAFLSIARI